MNTIKRAYNPLICLIAGFLCLIFLFFSYSCYSVRTRKESETENFSGFKCMSLGDESPYEGVKFINELIGEGEAAAFFLVLVAIALVFALIAAIALIALGVIGLLRESGGISIPGFSASLANKLGNIGVLANLGIHGFAAVSMILASIISTVSEGSGKNKTSMGMIPHVGMYFLIVIAAAAFVLLLLAQKKFGNYAATAAPVITYKCLECGAKSTKGGSCPICGGNVEAINIPKPEGPKYVYTCTSCGAKAKAGDTFCSICGGTVVSTEIAAPAKPANQATPAAASAPKISYKCNVCGAKAKTADKPCPICGGAVETIGAPPAAPAPETVPAAKASEGFKCSVCGAPASPDDKFCANCGGKVVSTAPVVEEPAAVDAPAAEFKCSVCGAPASPDDKFCANCGGKVI